MVNSTLNFGPSDPSKESHNGDAHIGGVNTVVINSNDTGNDSLFTNSFPIDENQKIKHEMKESKLQALPYDNNISCKESNIEQSSTEIVGEYKSHSDLDLINENSDNINLEKEEKLNESILPGSCTPTSVFDSTKSHLLTLDVTLTTLSLSNMKIVTLPDVFENFVNLSKIDLSMNQLSTLPGSFIKLNKLQFLNLSFNKFVNPPQCLHLGLYLIRELDLSHNQLEMFNMAPLCLPFLKTLKLNNNILRSPPQWLFRDIPSSVHLLNLSNNPDLTSKLNIDYFPLVTQSVSSKVVHLEISNCGLHDSSVQFLNHFTTVKILNIDNKLTTEKKNVDVGLNLIQDFPMKNLSICKSITNISLRNVSLTSISKDISNFENLEELDVINNGINWLPRTFCLLKNLKVFRASNCGLYFLPEEFGSLTSLQELYLDDNWLSCLPDNFHELIHLEVLDLYNNNFTQMPSLESFNDLKAFDIYMNNFEPPTEIHISNKTLNVKKLKESLVHVIKDSDLLTRIEKRRKSDDPVTDLSDEETPHHDISAASESSIEELCSSNGEEVLKITEDENWDEDVLGDDNFDPTASGTMIGLSPSSDDSNPSVPYYIREDKHYFRPYNKQLQFWGTVNPAFAQSSVEGQFDDV